MKLRVRGNSIRLRVTQRELDVLRDTGRVAERLEFPQSPPLTYALCVDDSREMPGAAFANGEIAVFLPRLRFEQWLNPQEVGICAAQALPDGGVLSLLIEKDFPCLMPRAGED